MSILLPENPAREDILAGKPTLWLNPGLRENGINDPTLPVRAVQVRDAEENWKRLAPLLCHCFPELEEAGGAIRSRLGEATELRNALGYSGPEFGRIFVKMTETFPLPVLLRPAVEFTKFSCMPSPLPRKAGCTVRVRTSCFLPVMTRGVFFHGTPSLWAARAIWA